MSTSLSNHNYGYQTSWSDLFFDGATGASGRHYAKRHLELAKIPSNDHPVTSHQIIAYLEYLPLIGGVVAMIERLAYALFSSYKVSWRKDPLSAEKTLQKMIKNGVKATKEHYNKFNAYFGNPYLTSINLSETTLTTKKEKPLKLKHAFAQDQGPRPTMEDAHFYIEMEKGALVGVFDGHGGSKVSQFASCEFQKRFPKILKEAEGNVHTAFESTIAQIHQDIVNNHPNWNTIGSTAVVSYIDEETHAIYTATLGDSEANIYRKTGWLGGVKSIALSCVRDWLSPKDAQRLINYWGYKLHGIFISKLKAQGLYDAKYVRSCLGMGGVNVARALGDVHATGTTEKPLVSQKPKITVNELKPGDTLILACDGLKDFVSEDEIVEIVEKDDFRAQKLVDAALINMNSKHNDNITVVAVKVS